MRADRTRLKQVLINILSNAIKYNRDGGTISVDITESTPASIRISIKDTGLGLPPEKVAKLFQSFNRLGQEAGGEEGTGIGLVMSKRLVELMDGVIGVESTVGVGSVFWIELCADTAPTIAVKGVKPATVAQAQYQDDAVPHTILYVEDNPANLKVVEQLVARRPDRRLLTAVTGRGGVKLARTSQPDMILMDINLPDISGIEAMSFLRKDPTTAHIPVVALSANAMSSDIEKGLAAGFFRYLTKPIKVKEFEETLNIALAFVQERKALVSGPSEIQQIDAEKPATTDTLTQEAEPLPDELIGRLVEAAMDADHDQLLLLADEIESLDKRKFQQVRHCIEKFDYQGLMEILETGGEK